MDRLLTDVRFALRQFVQRPGFTLVVVLTLALGIGGNAAIFTVVDQVVLQPLPYGQPERLVRIYTQFPGLGFDRFWMSAPEYLELTEWSRSYDAVGAYGLGAANVSGGETPVRTVEATVTASLFPTLGVAPQRGRWLEDDDNRPNADPVVVLGDGFWRRALGGDPQVVGSTLQVDGVTRTMVGVMPPGFDLEDAGIDVWTPATIDPVNPGGRGSHYLNVLARLSDRATLSSAREEMGALLARWDESFPDTHSPSPEGHPFVVFPYHDEVVGGIRGAAMMLLGAVAFVLLIACANVASLLLARAETRKREIAVRSALGAERGRLVRQFLTESVVLALTGGALGIALAWGGLKALLAAYPDAVPRSGEIVLDARALAFTALIAVATGLLFGLAPALRVRTGDLFRSLKEGGRGGDGVSTHAVRRGLVVAEVALATVLVLGAGLLLRSFWNLSQVDPGFEAGGVLSFQISLPEASYPETAQVESFYARLTERLAALPGVEAAAGVSGLPPRRDINANDTDFEGIPDNDDLPQNVDYYQIVTADAFRALGVPIVQGRGFTAADAAGSPPVAVINQTLADRFYPDQDPVGRRIRRGWWGDEEPWYTIVGVAADVKQGGLEEPAGTELFLLHDQWSTVEDAGSPRTLYLVVRSAGDPLALAGPAAAAVRALDPTLPLAEVRPLEQVVADSLNRPRLLALLLAVFALVALALATVGTYGVLAYAVEERRHEMGIRMALGATARDVLRLVVSQGMRPVVAGLVLGVVGAFALRQVLSSLLYGVAPTDPMTFATVPLLLVVVALAACLFPGRSATKVDPAVALRQE